MKEKKKLIQFTGEELVKEVTTTLTCPVCGIECASSWDVYEHISEEHNPRAAAGVAS